MAMCLTKSEWNSNMDVWTLKSRGIDSHHFILQVQKGYFRNVMSASSYPNEVRKQDFNGHCNLWSMNEGLRINYQESEELFHAKEFMFLFLLLETYNKTSNPHPTSCKVRLGHWFHCQRYKTCWLCGDWCWRSGAGPYRPPRRVLLELHHSVFEVKSFIIINRN